MGGLEDYRFVIICKDGLARMGAALGSLDDELHISKILGT
jgi:hypothetical protein